MFPETMCDPLEKHLERLKALFEEDRLNGTAGVFLPEALSRKYPKAGEKWIWQWVFPSYKLSRDPRSGVIRLHHMSGSHYQISFQGRVPKRVLIKE